MPKATRMLLIACCISCVSGCKLFEKAVAYIPGTRRIVSLDEGDPAPFDGQLLSPALMAELGPCLAQTLKDGGFRDAAATNATTPITPCVELDTPRLEFEPPIVDTEAFRLMPIPDPMFGADRPRDPPAAASILEDLPDDDLADLLRNLRHPND